MPLRKPLPMLAVCDEEEDGSEDASEESDDAEAVGVGQSVGLGDAAKKTRSPDLGGQLAGLSLGSNAVRDAYDDASPAGKKRGRGNLKRQDSFEVTETLTFKQGDVIMKQNGMIDEGSRQSISTLLYTDLEKERVLGRGATAKVWLMRHKLTGQLLAVKELTAMADDDTRRMAVNELRISHKHARHAHYLVRFLDAFFHDGKICIAMEFCDAGSYQDIIKASAGGVATEALGAITLQMLRGVQYLHREMHQVGGTGEALVGAATARRGKAIPEPSSTPTPVPRPRSIATSSRPTAC